MEYNSNDISLDRFIMACTDTYKSLHSRRAKKRYLSSLRNEVRQDIRQAVETSLCLQFGDNCFSVAGGRANAIVGQYKTEIIPTAVEGLVQEITGHNGYRKSNYQAIRNGFVTPRKWPASNGKMSHKLWRERHGKSRTQYVNQIQQKLALNPALPLEWARKARRGFSPLDPIDAEQYRTLMMMGLSSIARI